MEKKENDKKTFSALSLAWELGYLIAIPIVVLALIGRALDKYFDSSPWLLLAGILFSIIISSYGVYYKTMRVFNDFDDKK